MIQVVQASDPWCAVRFIAGAERGERVARAAQSEAASDLLSALRARAGIGEGASSKAHSRDLAAAALSVGGVVGVDIEYREPGRPIEAIGHYLMDAPVRDAIAGYRVFTFYEAYFKALGDFPEKALLRAAADETAERYALGGLQVLQQPVSGDFYLTLVWRAGW